MENYSYSAREIDRFVGDDVSFTLMPFMHALMLPKIQCVCSSFR
jgi:hypothetical protein